MIKSQFLLALALPCLFVQGALGLLFNFDDFTQDGFSEQALQLQDKQLRFIKNMRKVFDDDRENAGKAESIQGVLRTAFNADIYPFLDGPWRFDIEFTAPVTVNRGDTTADLIKINGRAQKMLVAYMSKVTANGNANVQLGDLFDTVVQGDADVAVVDEASDQLPNIAAVTLAEDSTPLGPAVFCLFDSQCTSTRRENRFGDKIRNNCRGLDVAGTRNFCDDFVAKFTLQWLLVLIVATYGIIVLWALYFGYPWLKRQITGKKKGDRGPAKSQYTEAEQIVINTMAAQCASAENLLLQATDYVKQAANLENILSVEAKKEAKIMLMTCEYFQCVCSIAVALCHQNLDHKANTPGQNFNAEEGVTTRALQLEVLNYVKDRLHLAFNSDPLTTKSLYRIAEAYAILTKITESIVLVGFTFDRKFPGSLGELRTPVVKFTEDALFLSGSYRNAMNIAGMENMEGQTVAVVMDGSDARGLRTMNSNLYLASRQKASKIYDPKMQMVKPGAGTALAFNTQNQAQNGEGLQFFVRSFWANEIAAIQGEADRWLEVDGALEAFCDSERQKREARAAPMVQKSGNAGGRRRRRRRNRDKPKEEGYAEGDDKTEITETSEATGLSVLDTNTYVFNVESVVSQGLGITGKPGMPYDKPGEKPIKKGNKFYQWFEANFPNYAAWPKFYTFVFVVMPFFIILAMFVKRRKGGAAIDIDGNVAFKARVAGFGISYLGVPAYYFLDGFVPEDDDLVQLNNNGEVGNNVDNAVEINGETVNLVDVFQDPTLGLDADPFGTGDFRFFISNADAQKMFEDEFDGKEARKPENLIGEIQAGILAQSNSEELLGIRNQQKRQEITTVFVYGLMHCAGYFFGIVPITLVRESLEIIARRLPVIRQIYPMSLWRELHMHMGLAGIFYVAFGATVFLVTALTAIGKSTPFAGLAGDPDIPAFFNFADNVLYIRQVLLPFVPLLFLMKYASRGPPAWMRKFCPTFITKNYWEICYFLHYFTALTAIITLVIYRAQVFYWMGATWGLIWGGNIMVRILRTRRTTIKHSNLVSYKVHNSATNANIRSDVLRVTLNVPASFPSSARGQACWITVPAVDLIAHPFTLAKSPTADDKTIMFHIGVKYLKGDDIISYEKPEEPVKKAPEAAPKADPGALPMGWKSAVDPTSGSTYYYNSAEGITQWEPPVNNAVGKMWDGVRGITTRMSANVLRMGSSRFGGVSNLKSTTIDPANTKQFAVSGRATWTQLFAQLNYQLSTMDPDLRRNHVKTVPVYVSAPLGTSMDDCLKPTLPGSIIITTQNGLPAAESSVRWLLKQKQHERPRFHFFVSVSREVNDALSVVETLRDAMCESVLSGNINIDGLNGRHAHMCDWLGVYIHLTRRKPATIEADRDSLMESLAQPAAPVSPTQLDLINEFIKNRVSPGRLPFDRFLARTQQMVRKRTGLDEMAVGYCGSAPVAHSIRSACRALNHVKFDGEFI